MRRSGKIHWFEDDVSRAISIRGLISPLAWQHVNFYGRYQFNSDLMSINMAELIAQLVGPDAKLWQNIA